MSPAKPGPFARFEPQSPVALATAETLLRAGARVLHVSRTHVELQRMESIARIDQAGRVEWRPAEAEATPSRVGVPAGSASRDARAGRRAQDAPRPGTRPARPLSGSKPPSARRRAGRAASWPRA